MAARRDSVEPAFVWALLQMLQGVLAWEVESVHAASHAPGAPACLAVPVLAALSALSGLAVGAAMASPAPERRSAGDYPPWVRGAWAVLGRFPPPVLGLRLALAGGASLCLLLAAGNPGTASYFVAVLPVLAAGLVRRPKSALEMSGAESALALGTAALMLFLGAQVFESQGAQGWLAAAGLLPLILLQGQRAREISSLRWKELAPGLPPPPALDLERYELSARGEAAAAPERPPDAEGAVFVGSGSFRVDASRMLEKLRERQLADPRDFVLAWLRCAAASGAGRIELRRVPRGLELRFDGRPFSPAELARPYQALLDGEAPEGQRGRHFAYGLLALYRLKPASVSMASRGPQGLATLELAARGAAAPPPEADALGLTVVRVRWPAWASWWRTPAVLSRARLHFGLGPAELTLDGEKVSPVPPEALVGGRRFEAEGWRGVYRSWGGTGESRVRVYCLGTFVEELPDDMMGGPVEAWLGHDGLALDISQSAVQRGELLDSGLRLLHRKVAGM